MQEEECLKFDKQNVEINVGAMFKKNKVENTDIAELKSIFQASMTESNKKMQELTMQVASLTKLVNGNNTHLYTTKTHTTTS